MMNFVFISGTQVVSIEPQSLSVNIENVLNGLGMKLTDADDYLLNLIHHISTQSLQLVRPRASFSIFENPRFDIEQNVLWLNNAALDLGKTITSVLRKSEWMIVFAATIGHDLEHWSKQEMKAGNSLEGYIIDLVGSELAENTVDHLHLKLQLLAESKGYGITNRYSPGYCNWPVSDQHNLFKLFGESNCGIELSESSLMLPVKSVSGIMGVGKGLKRADYKCRFCDDNKCILRKQFH